MGRNAGHKWDRMGGIKGRANSFGPTLCSSAPRPPASDEECKRTRCMWKRKPFKGCNFEKGIIILNNITTIFTIFLAILEKPRLVDLLVRLINKLYPAQYYFEVYALMFL